MKIKGELFLLLCAFLWGGTFGAIKLALDSSSPTIFLAIRFSIAFLILLPFYFRTFTQKDKRAFIESMILGALLFASFETQMIGLKFTTATKSGFITGTFIFFTPILQAISEKKFPPLRTIAGVFIVIAGLLLISVQGNSISDLLSTSHFNFGDFITFFCAIIISAYIIYLDKIGNRNDPIFLVMMQLGITALLAIVFALLFNLIGIEKMHFQPNIISISALLYTAIFASVITTILQTKFQYMVKPSRASMLFSLEPVFSAIVAFLMVGERLDTTGIIGALLIAIGILVSEINFRKEEPD